MAALFKVARHDKPTERKIIRAATIDGLISAAKSKLKLTDENFQIYTDDFTEIDEDEILLQLAHSKESKGEQLLLTIVPDGISWNCNVLEKNTSNLSTGIHQKSSSSSSNSHQPTEKSISPISSSTPCPADELSKCFAKFSTNIQTVLRNGTTLDPKDYRSMVRTLRDYLIHDVKDTSRGRAGNLSKQIVTTYKQTFTPTIGSKSIDAAMETLRQSIYHAVNYQKGQLEKDHRRTSCLDEPDDESIRKTKVQDEYGCVAYLPDPPSSEVLKVLQEKQLKLNDLYSSPDQIINDEIITFMNECYYLQRKIIHQQKNLSIIFEQWPYFYHFKLIIQHANQLLGKKTDSKWKESINKLAKPINCWSKHEEIVREVKDKKKKLDNDDKRYVREALKLAKTYSDNLKNDEPYHTVIFGFIAKFMKEDVKFLYILIGEEVTDEELIQHVPVVNPMLIIRGKDLHDSQNRYNIVIEKDIILHADSFKDGLLTTFLAYYVFGIVYPKEIEGTLETIQRLFLEICPSKGTKRGGNRKATNVHPKVIKLSTMIEPYTTEYTKE